MKKTIAVFIIIGLFLFAGLLYAADIDDAKALVEKAAAYVKEQGKEKALAEIGRPGGMFDKVGSYVFAYDLQGVVIANPENPALIGQNLIDVPDSKGKLFRKEIVEKAKSEGSGWVDYVYLNPETQKEENKTTYILRVGDIILCCGVYLGWNLEGD